jgi:signal transduction histidine kinase
VWNDSRVITVSTGAMNLLELSCEDGIKPQLEVSTTLAERAESVFLRLRDAAAWREEVILGTSSNRTLPCEMTHVTMRFDNEQCILTYIRDLREQKRHEMALLAAKEQAEVAAQAKSEFLARMSHEIRTPMNGVIGLTQMALAASPSPKQRELLEKIQASAQILLGIINDILDFSKLEQGKVELESCPFSLVEMFGTIADLLEPQAAKKNIVFEQRIDTAMFAQTLLEGDSLRLSQVLLNLCGNAVKFTEMGTVTLSVTCLDKATDAVSLRFTVKDTGIGLTEEQLPLLFQPFTQADSSTTRKFGGTGLGLMISGLLVEQMGGAISVVSEPGAGSEFSFTIRLRVSRESADEPLELAAAEPKKAPSLSGKSILVAEDNEVNQLIIVSFLESLGIAVTLANNGQEAIELAGRQAFDCIFMDIQMPVMDGLTATKAIRDHGRPEINGIPIIAMTAHAMPDDVQKSLEAGMNAHVTKPIDYEQLVILLLKVLG